MADNNPVSSTTQSIAVSALRAQQARMRIIAENLANANSTSKTAGGDPYRRQGARCSRRPPWPAAGRACR